MYKSIPRKSGSELLRRQRKDAMQSSCRQPAAIIIGAMVIAAMARG